MKRIPVLIAVLLITLKAGAQTNPSADYDHMMFYLTSIRENAASIRSTTNSEKVANLLDQISAITDSIESEMQVLSDSQSQETQEVEEILYDIEEDTTFTNDEPELMEIETEIEIDIDESEKIEPEEGVSVSRFIPFNKKFNTLFKVEFGVNNLIENHTRQQGLSYPDINTGGSWYWNWTLMRRARLGGKSSRFALNYGFSYLLNRYQIENDLRLTTNENQEVLFLPIEDANKNPKLSIGYITVPLSFSISLGKKTKIELGGFAGYRVHTVQRFSIKNGRESIQEKRYARYGLNNWQYGAFASIDVKGIDLIFRYVPVSLFEDSRDYDYQTLMVGTSVSFF
jgi:hypothetical protein